MEPFKQFRHSAFWETAFIVITVLPISIITPILPPGRTCLLFSIIAPLTLVSLFFFVLALIEAVQTRKKFYAPKLYICLACCLAAGAECTFILSKYATGEIFETTFVASLIIIAVYYSIIFWRYAKSKKTGTE